MFSIVNFFPRKLFYTENNLRPTNRNLSKSKDGGLKEWKSLHMKLKVRQERKKRDHNPNFLPGQVGGNHTKAKKFATKFNFPSKFVIYQIFMNKSTFVSLLKISHLLIISRISLHLVLINFEQVKLQII